MTDPSFNSYYLVQPLIATIISFFLIVLVFFKAPKSSSKRVFIWLLSAVALSSFFVVLMRSSPDAERALLWDRGAIVSGLAIFVFFYNFTLEYTHTSKQKSRLASYALLLLIILLSPTELLLKGMTREYYGYAPVMGYAGYLVVISTFVFMLEGWINLFRHYKAVRYYEERNRVLHLSIAVVFPFVGGLLDGLTNIPPAGVWGNLIFCIICTVAILRYHLFDIRFVIRKGLSYVLVSLIVALPYVSILVFVPPLFEAKQLPWWGYVILLFAMAAVLRPLYTLIQRLVDRMFYRDTYDHLKALEQFSRQAQSVLDLRELASEMVKLVSNALRASSCNLLLSSEEQGDLKVVSPAGAEDPGGEIKLRKQSVLIKWLSTHAQTVSREDLDVIPQFQSLSRSEKINLDRLKAKLLVPIIGKSSGLSGMLVLGKRLSDQPYSPEDERLLLTVCNQMGTEVENAVLYAKEERARALLADELSRKTEFLHGVAHELKTPLTSIVSSSEMIAIETGAAGSQNPTHKLSQNILNSALRMDRRINDLLDLARMDSGTLKANPVPVVFSAALQGAVSDMNTFFASKQQKLEIRVPADLPLVMADKDRLEQVLMNLLSNAYKYSPEECTITVKAKSEGTYVVVQIEDCASELGEKEIERLFVPYYRGENVDRRDRIPGLGLGLVISKRLVELQNGKIWAKSRPGKGNTFAFSLPVAKAG